MKCNWKVCHLIFLFLFLGSILSAAEARKPNILFILTDDQRWDTLGCYGNDVIRTPNLDKLAAQGARLDAFYVAQPLCCPSRATFLTGLYPHQTGIYTNEKGGADLPKGSKTVAHYLNEAGYKTGFVGKAHIGGDPRKWGFQTCPVFLPGGSSPHKKPDLVYVQREKVPGYITTIFADAAINFIESNKSQPWFLWLATTAPHTPYIDDPKYAYDPAKLKPPPGWPHPFKFEPEIWKKYYATITMMDAEVGRVLLKIQQLALTDQTFVLMASDNGYMFDSHGVDSKNTWFEGSARVPAVARWPNHIKSGSKISHPISSVDLLPTLVEIAGGQPPKNLEGVSMIPSLTNRNPMRTEIFSESSRWKMIRKESWKYVIASSGKEHLYNLKEDPFELKDLVKRGLGPPALSQLGRAMENWLKQTPSIPGARINKKEEEKENKKNKKKQTEETETED
ncbi:sulfatase-like hydrolase/transferase [bacterium]|nr:sulfatase-like hydrolase/transferase [bacterium]